ncbi:MAG TPA: caspase family protein [Candidatus Cloacimonadota bacterium]|nr:caspase family protein [Candidatus Cloacimonadota bacterium]
MKRLLVLYFALLISLSCQAGRKALVIGNAIYNVNLLSSPAKDAELVAETLTQLGFTVKHVADIDYNTFDAELKNFTGSLSGGDEAFFYFGGIALQLEGENYLLPTGFNYKSANDIRFFSIPLKRVLEDMSKANYAMLFVDGSRENSFSTLAGGQIGLAEPAAVPPNAILQFSTAPNVWLESDLLPTSKYAQSLVNQLRISAQNMEKICSATSETVARLTAEAQIPWTVGSLPNYYYINNNIINDGGSGLDDSIVADNMTFKEMDLQPGIVTSTGLESSPAPVIYTGDDAHKLYKTSKFGNIIDVFSASEFIMTQSKDSNDLSQFASWNMVRLNLAMFGAEAYYKKMLVWYKGAGTQGSGLGVKQTDITQMGAGAGLQNPDFIRLFATMNKYEYSDPNVNPLWGEDLADYYNYSFSFAKRVRANRQSLQLGADFLYNPEGYPEAFLFQTSPFPQAYSFDDWDFAHYPSWKLSSYLYTTDVYTDAHESLHLAGVAPKDRPLLFTRQDGVLFGLTFNMEERSGQSYSMEDYQRYQFSVLLHKNFGKAVGFDFNFDYNDSLMLDTDEHYKNNQFRGTMRLTLVDAGPLALSTAIDYVNRGQLSSGTDPDEATPERMQGINGAAFLILDISKRLIISGMGQINMNWFPSDTLFKLEQTEFFFGGTVGLRL